MNNKALIILGMHRSGTSALARVINLLGVDLGPDLVPPRTDNPTGFWEHKRVMEINEGIFQLVGRHWTCCLRPLPHEWWLRQDVALAAQEIVALLRRDFGNVPLWGLKDPRLCRLLPLWSTVWDEVGTQPHFIHIFRNPQEVAASLHKRDGLVVPVSHLLWLLHVLEAERYSRGRPRVFVSFDGLLRDWRTVMLRAARALGMDWNGGMEEAGPAIDRFLDPEMKHHGSEAPVGLRDENSIPLVVMRVYEVLKRMESAGNDGPAIALGDIYGELCEEIGTSGGTILSEGLEQATCMLFRERMKRNECELLLTEITHSRFWRLTSPLRKSWERLLARESK